MKSSRLLTIQYLRDQLQPGEGKGYGSSHPLPALLATRGQTIFISALNTVLVSQYGGRLLCEYSVYSRGRMNPIPEKVLVRVQTFERRSIRRYARSIHYSQTE